MVWFGVFYRLAKPAAKALFDKGIWIISGIAVENFMLFGKKLGTLSSVLSFETGVNFSGKEILLNSLVVIILIVSLYLIFRFLHKHIFKALLVVILALSVMAPIDIISINSQVKDVKETAEANREAPGLPCIKTVKTLSF